MADPLQMGTSLCTSTVTCSSRNTFTSIPREIRDEIYAYVLIDHTNVHIRNSNNTINAFTFLKRHLPQCLLLSHQIVEEAGAAYFQHASVITQGTQLAMFAGFLDCFSGDILWKSIRDLEFANYEYGKVYAYPTEAECSAGVQLCIHDIAVRCPGLRNLTISLSPDVFRTPSIEDQRRDGASLDLTTRIPGANISLLDTWENWRRCPSILTPDEITGNTNLLRVLELEKLLHLTVRFDATRYTTGIGDDDCARELEEVFAQCTVLLEAEIKKQGRRLDIVQKVKMWPKVDTQSWVSRPGYVPAGMHPLVWG
ncbi:hypothetical protein FB567DRAFT_518471 [Paraphoma chrysanthemicola]|uniref:F-box domain-containing protein n=1 Tax=Paraphoma chrysanthemicola TaxID=798071 RepID=A0A8K0REH3_9PLEO|nr:hypothetical protein FB567DRAFT_518471 [Paraphoma chrysanthemicola]